MLFGGRLKYPTTDPDAIAAQRQAELGRIFPDLAQSRIDYSWGGYIDIGLNKAPQFGRKNPQIYYAQGFAGHGVALTGLAGQLIAQAIHQESLGFDLFARLKPPKIPLHALTSQPLVHCAIAFYRMCDRLGV
jgi:gamma-glutamylputrescine oxidase